MDDDNLVNVEAVLLNRQVWFEIGSVCRALGIEDQMNALCYLDTDDKLLHTFDSLIGPQYVMLISAHGWVKLNEYKKKMIANKDTCPFMFDYY